MNDSSKVSIPVATASSFALMHRLRARQRPRLALLGAILLHPLQIGIGWHRQNKLDMPALSTKDHHSSGVAPPVAKLIGAELGQRSLDFSLRTLGRNLGAFGKLSHLDHLLRWEHAWCSSI